MEIQHYGQTMFSLIRLNQVQHHALIKEFLIFRIENLNFMEKVGLNVLKKIAAIFLLNLTQKKLIMN